MKCLRKLIALSFLFVFLFHVSVLAADKGTFSTTPKTNNGKKWRIGYYEGGEYIFYQHNFLAMVNGLIDLGWINKIIIPHQKGEQTKDLWLWLANNAKSKYIQFVKDAHYSSQWEKSEREKVANALINRLNRAKDIDLMITAGTWAGQDLANNKHKTPTLVISTSDSLGAGIIKSIEDSGYDHIHARIDPYRYERQIQIFHDIIGFKKLGMAYENSDRGKTYAALDKVKEVSQELGFETTSCFTIDENPDVNIAEKSLQKCFKYLVKKVDAIYVTKQSGLNAKNLPALVEIANSEGIPTFSQSGAGEVKAGFLLSISSAGFKYVGMFYAKTMAKILNGAKPRQLDQVFEGPPKIAINLKTAQIIGYDPPVDVLGAADEIFQEIGSK